MRFLFDESVELRLVPRLVERGHDVEIIGVNFPASLSDSEVLQIAHKQSRILVTNDTDFGELAIRGGYHHAGIILMRLSMLTTSEKGVRLLEVIETYTDSLSRFVVISPGGVRVR